MTSKQPYDDLKTKFSRPLNEEVMNTKWHFIATKCHFVYIQMPFRAHENEDLRSISLRFNLIITSFWAHKYFVCLRIVLYYVLALLFLSFKK